MPPATNEHLDLEFFLQRLQRFWHVSTKHVSWRDLQAHECPRRVPGILLR